MNLEVIVKVLLVALNAKYIHSNLAVYSLMAYAKKYTRQMKLLEMTINQAEEDILKEIYRQKADVVAFSCYIWNISMINRICIELKKVQPAVKIWLGGPECSYDAKSRLQTMEHLDGIVIGEGEQTFLELMEHYVDGVGRLDDIQGIGYRNSVKVQEKGKLPEDYVIITGERQPMNLDLIPFPYEDIQQFNNRIIYYESSRGCPFSCSYCLSSIDKKVRLRSTELVKKELQFLLDQELPQVKFVDRTFNCNKRHAMEIWSFIKERDNGITNFHFEISADLLDEDEIRFLNTLRPGQVQFEIGVQSTNPDTIKAIHRTMDFEKLSRCVKLIREGRNIHQHLDLIAGLPLEGYSSFVKSFNDVYKLKPDQLQLGFLKILKGSSMELDSGTYKIVYRDTPPYEVLFTDSLSYEELLRIKGVCDMVELYYNSGQFDNSVRFLEHFFDTPFQLYESISNYYESKGLELLSHSRVKRYEILLDFFRDGVLELRRVEDEPELLALFEEILLLDLLLRENIKSVPSFMKGKKTDQDLRSLYEKHKIENGQIRIEAFSRNVFVGADTGKVSREKLLLLFDYKSRDPLNKAAKVTLL